MLKVENFLIQPNKSSHIPDSQWSFEKAVSSVYRQLKNVIGRIEANTWISMINNILVKTIKGSGEQANSRCQDLKNVRTFTWEVLQRRDSQLGHRPFRWCSNWARCGAWEHAATRRHSPRIPQPLSGCLLGGREGGLQRDNSDPGKQCKRQISFTNNCKRIE